MANNRGQHNRSKAAIQNQIRTANEWGRRFEQEVLAMCQEYRRIGVAKIFKAQPTRAGELFPAFAVGGRAPVDFTGRMVETGTPIAFDCKHITRSATWFSEPEYLYQMQYLVRVQRQGGLAFVLFHDGDLGQTCLCRDVVALAKGGRVRIRDVDTSGAVYWHQEVVPQKLLKTELIGWDFLPVALNLARLR